MKIHAKSLPIGARMPPRRAAHISTLNAAVGGKFKYSGARAIRCHSTNMAAIFAGFSAPESSAPLPPFAPSDLPHAQVSAAQDAPIFREDAAPPCASAQVVINDAPSSGGGVGGAAPAAQGAQAPQEQGARKRRVVKCKKCGGEGHMAKTCTGDASASGAAPPPRRMRQQAGEAGAPRDDPAQIPYRDEEDEDVVAEDADDIDVEIECYRFQPGDFTWQ
jgi:hypothetical protein